MATVSTDSSELMRRVMEIPGFGPVGASSMVATLGGGQAFKCGRGSVGVVGTDIVPAQQRW